MFDKWLYDQLSTIQQVKVCGYAVRVFPPLENGLILLGHINQHLSSGLSLRQIIDWYYYVQSELDDEFWNNEFKLKPKLSGWQNWLSL